MRRYKEANALYIKVLEIAPDDADSRYNHSHLLLQSGNFALGWDKYESRWQSTDAPPYPFGEIPLLGSIENIKDSKVLIWAEQGLGDTIQFVRYVALVSSLGAKVTLLVQPDLLTLLKNIEGPKEVVCRRNQDEAFDFQIPLMSLPRLFKTDSFNVPANIPYLFAAPEKSKDWKKKLSSDVCLKVGIVWSGGFRKDFPSLWAVNHRRNIPFEKIAALQTVQGVSFYSLQKGEPAESEFLRDREAIWTEHNLSNVANELVDFSDTAGLIDNLDLIVSVDTSTAHLAAAMGKPVWILSRYDSCWRWLLDRLDSIWYPTVRLYNQKSPGDWDTVLSLVARDLGDLVKK